MNLISRDILVAYNENVPDCQSKTVINIWTNFGGVIYGCRWTIFLKTHFNEIFDDKEHVEKIVEEKGLQTITKKFKDIEKHIVQKAINIKAKQENSLLQFVILKEELEIESIEELQTDKLADFDVKIIVSKNTNYDDIDNSDKLGLVMKFLDNIFAELKDKIAPKIGSEFIAGDFKKFFADPKTKTIEPDDDSERIAKELETPFLGPSVYILACVWVYSRYKKSHPLTDGNLSDVH